MEADVGMVTRREMERDSVAELGLTLTRISV